MRTVLLIVQWILWLVLLYMAGSIAMMLLAGIKPEKPVELASKNWYIIASVIAGATSFSLLSLRKNLFWKTPRYSVSSAGGFTIFLITTLASAFLAFMSTGLLMLLGLIATIKLSTLASILIAVVFLVLLFPKLPKGIQG